MGAARLINRTTHGTPGDDNHILALHFEGQAGGRAAFECSLQSWAFWIIYQCSCDATDDLSICFTGGGTWTGGKFTQLHKPAFDPPPPSQRPPETNAADFAIKSETGKHDGR